MIEEPKRMTDSDRRDAETMADAISAIPADKRERVRDALSRIGGLTVDVAPVIGMDDPWRYRNKTSLPVGGETTHAAMSGHRGLPSARLFSDLDKIQEGDTFTVTVTNTPQLDDGQLMVQKRWQTSSLETSLRKRRSLRRSVQLQRRRKRLKAKNRQ